MYTLIIPKKDGIVDLQRFSTRRKVFDYLHTVFKEDFTLENIYGGKRVVVGEKSVGILLKKKEK